MSDSKRNIMWPLALTLIVLALLAGGAFWLSQSSLLAVETVVVNGNHSLSEEEVMAIVGPRLYGKSLLRYSFDDAGDALRELPFVENVEIKRDFPHTVYLEIREYRPVTSYAGANGRNYLLADGGRVLAIAEQPDASFPGLSTGEACEAEVGGNMGCDDVLTGLAFLAAVPLNLNQEFSQVKVIDGSIDADTRSGIEVHFGTMQEYAYKFEVLRQLIARSLTAGEQVAIDVSVPDRPVIRSKSQPLVTEDPEAAEGEGSDAIPEAEAEAPAYDDEVIIEEGYEPAVEEAWVE